MVFCLYSLVYLPHLKNNFLFFLLFTNLLFSQEFSILNDKYSGVLSGIQNPASIVNTPYKVDINILSNFTSIGNNLGGLDYLKLYNDSNISINSTNNLDSIIANADFKDLDSYIYNLNLNDHTYSFNNSTLLGPSFLLSLSSQDAIGVYTSVRLNSFLFNINSKLLLDTQFESLDELSKFHGNNIRGYGQVTAWAELGLTYSKVIYQRHDKILKLGITAKFLKGLKHYSVKFNTFETKLNLNSVNPLRSTLNVNGSIDLENSSSSFNYGQGLDIGFVFEKNKKHYHSFHATKYNRIYFNTANYTYRFGFSITDIGFINFEKNKKEKKLVDINAPTKFYNYERFLLSSEQATEEKSTYILPTTVHLNFDYNFYKSLYLNSNLDVFLFPYSQTQYLKSISNLTVGLRFEKLKFSISNSLNIDILNNLKYLLHVRTGYFYAGGSLLLKNYEFNYNHHSVFVGFKIPFYH